jgi:hypothetical protein
MTDDEIIETLQEKFALLRPLMSERLRRQRIGNPNGILAPALPDLNPGKRPLGFLASRANTTKLNPSGRNAHAVAPAKPCRPIWRHPRCPRSRDTDG